MSNQNVGRSDFSGVEAGFQMRRNKRAITTLWSVTHRGAATVTGSIVSEDVRSVGQLVYDQVSRSKPVSKTREQNDIGRAFATALICGHTTFDHQRCALVRFCHAPLPILSKAAT